MKKYGLRILVGLIAFVIGLVGVWLLISDATFNIYCNKTLSFNSEIQTKQISKKLDGKVIVRFIRFAQTENGNFVEFDIENNTDETIYYSDYEPQDESKGISPLFDIKVNGKGLALGWCGTGLALFPIKSGESKVFQVPARVISYHLKRGKDIQIGFSFSKGSERSFQKYWSEKLPISGEIEKLLLKEKDEFEKLIR